MKILKKIFGKSDIKIHVDEIAVTKELLLGGAVIVEEGNNANGRWIKFGDGTMISYVNRVMETTPNVALGSMFRNTPEQWAFPKPFILIPHTVAHVIKGTYYGSVVMGTEDSNAHQVNFSVLSPISYTSEIPVVSLIAIGRWK